MSNLRSQSSVPYLGIIPNSWQIDRNKRLFEHSKKIVGSKSHTTQLLSLTTKGIRKKDIRSAEGKLPSTFDTYQLVRENQLVLCLFDLDQSAVFAGRSPHDGMISPAYTVLNCNERIRPEFADYWFTYIFMGRKYAYYAKNLRYTMTWDDFSQMFTLVPSLDEQDRIVEFLDVETTKIDHLIAKQRKLIDLVEARETARRNQALDAVIGTPVRLKWLLSPSRTRASGSEEVLSVYRDYGVIRKDSRTDNFNRTPEDVSNYLVVRPGDLVVNKMKAWQGSLGVSEFHGIVSGDYEVLRPTNKEVDLRFLHFLLRSRRLVNEYAIRSKGIRPSQWRLYWQELSEIEIPLPPISTQKAVAESVGNTKDDRTILAACEHMIELLQERRSALITAAVTGKIEV